MTWNGQMCKKGPVASPCQDKASDSCKNACKQGIESACEQVLETENDRLLRTMCQKGVASACLRLARATKEMIWLDRACDLGDVVSCTVFTSMILSGNTRFDGDATRLWNHRSPWLRACHGGLAEWCWSWAQFNPSEHPRGRRPNRFETLVRGCQRGHKDSCFEAAKLERLYTSAPNDRDDEEDQEQSDENAQWIDHWTVANLLTASCADPNPNWDGCMALGEALLVGDGFEPSEDRAMAVFERVCSMKVRSGCSRAGRLAQDKDRAFSLLGKACSLGDLDACIRAADLGGMTGEGRRWLTEACERFGHAPACHAVRK